MIDENLCTPDFSECVEFDDSQVPPGVYKVRVDSWTVKTSKATETPYVNWKLVIFGAEGELAKQNNRVAFLMTMLKGKGTGVLKQFLIATLGELPTTWEPGWQNNLIGKELQVTLVKNIKPDGTEGMANVKNVSAIRQ